MPPPKMPAALFTPAEHTINAALAAAFAPRSTERIADWAARNIRLTAVEGSFRDLPYDVSHTPIINSFFDWWQDPATTTWKFVIMKGSQFGVTLASIIGASYDYANDPVNVLYLANDETNAREVVRRRFDPILRQISDRIADDIDGTGTLPIKNINGALLIYSGAQVSTRLISWPITKVICDEAALHKKTAAGHSTEQAAQRTEKQPGRKMLVFSKPETWPVWRATPTTGTLENIGEDTSHLTEEWISGTQEVPMVPCPHCAGLQEFTDKQLRAPKAMLPGLDLLESDLDLDEISRHTWYECTHCAHPIYDEHKPEMVRNYVLQPAPLDRQEAKKRGFARTRVIAVDPRHPDIIRYKRPTPGVRSLHVSDIYNLLSPTCSFGAIHVKKLLALRDPEKNAVYHKDTLGLPKPEVRHSTTANSKLLLRLCGAYPRLGIIDPLTGLLQPPLHPLPCQAKRLTVQIDYQQGEAGQASYFPFTLTAFDDKDQDWTVDYGILRSWQDIEDLLKIEFTLPDGKTTGRIMFGLMDSQHDTTAVIEFCLLPGIYGTLWPSAGVSKLLDIDRRDLTEKYGVVFWVLNYKSLFWEERLYSWHLAKWCEFLDPTNPARLHTTAAARHAQITPRPFLPIDVCQDFLDQLSNMHCTPKSPTDPTLGTTWTKIHTGRPNDYGDCKKLAIITRAFYKMAAA